MLRHSALIGLLVIVQGMATQSQPVINKDDMPNIGDTIRLSHGVLPPGSNYQAAGNNITWNFSNLQPLSQSIDTFLNVLSTSPFYYPSFLLSASIAANGPDLSYIPNVTFTDVYEFYKETAASFTLVGYGASISGLPLTPKFNPPDLLYKFPLTVGSSDSATAVLELAIPGFFDFKETRKRVNHVDGWGTLITPFGSFSTVRVRSEVIDLDSLYLDTLGSYVPLAPKIYTEYKWLADNKGIPVLLINEPQMGVPTVSYIDSARNTGTGLLSGPELKPGMIVYPNPTTGQFFIDFESESKEVIISVFGIDGSLNGTYRFASTQHPFMMSVDQMGLKHGLYLIQVKDGTGSRNQLLVVRD